MKKSTKDLLFERMNIIAGMPVNETSIMSNDQLKRLGMPTYEHEVSPEVMSNATEEFPENDESPNYQVKLDYIKYCATQLHDKIAEFDELPTWVQDKITIAHHNLEAIGQWMNTLGHEADEHGGLVDESENHIDEDIIDESENKPNDPSLWSQVKSQAKKKFDVYPSAYANAWASKKYKEKGGTWSKKK